MGLTKEIIAEIEGDRNLQYKLAIYLNVSQETISNWLAAEKDSDKNVRRYPLRSEAAVQFLSKETGKKKWEIISDGSEIEAA